MALFRFLNLFPSTERLAELAQKIATQNLPAVQQRLTGLTPSMATAEIRGYVRARASVILRQAVAAAIRQQQAAEASAEQLLELAMERVIATAAVRRPAVRQPVVAARRMAA